MPRIPRFHLAWMLINLVGIAAFLGVASLSWVEPEVAGPPGTNLGAAFVWVITAVPILLVFALYNLLWLALSLRHRLYPLAARSPSAR